MSQHIKIYRFVPENNSKNENFAVINYKDLAYTIDRDSSYREGFYCILMIEQGEAVLKVNGYEKKLTPPVLVCGLPGDVWEWKQRENIEGTFICFEGPFLLAGLNGSFSLEPIPFLNSDTHYPFIPLSDRTYQKLKNLINEMKECLHDYPIYYDLIRVELWQFLFISEKEYVINGNEGRKNEINSHILKFINLVNEFYPQNHDVQFYADKLNITPNYLNKITKIYLGVNARDYIFNRIISEAKILLRLTHININEVAYRLGFDNTNYFIKCFKKIVGTTPGEYQKLGTL